MTQDEKFAAIVERINTEAIDIDSRSVSALVLAGYVDDIVKIGIIESGFDVTEKGKAVRAICEEFDWKPTDEHIVEFVKEIVGPKEQSAFLYLLKKYRDNREELIAEFQVMKNK